jgi:hypothetical protein
MFFVRPYPERRVECPSTVPRYDGRGKQNLVSEVTALHMREALFLHLQGLNVWGRVGGLNSRVRLRRKAYGRCKEGLKGGRKSIGVSTTSGIPRAVLENKESESYTNPFSRTTSSWTPCSLTSSRLHEPTYHQSPNLLSHSPPDLASPENNEANDLLVHTHTTLGAI